jgi:FdhD protein
MSNNVTIFSANGSMSETSGEIPKEFPLKLIVNGIELATLISSPHDLRFLVAGFLLLQGYVQRVEDFEMLSVCEDFGIANVKIKGELPERPPPVLTSGCGSGISFSIPEARPGIASDSCFVAAEIFAVFEELSSLAGRYRSHGGIHSAAIACGGKILFHSEDLGRHNAVDRLAGEALLRGVSLQGKLMVTSGRISSEMAAKAAQMGIAAIASRTSPTDMAVRICEETEISLIGYVRGGRFSVYAHPEKIDRGKVPGVTGVILAGGSSRRMGRDKAMLDFHGKPLIQEIHDVLAGIFQEVIVVANDPDRYKFLPCRIVSDIFQGKGTLAGIHAGLLSCGENDAFVVACDMPFLQQRLIRHIVTIGNDSDVVLPSTPEALQPLHALYRKSCLPVIERQLIDGNLSVLDIYPQLRTITISPKDVKFLDPQYRSFINLNTLNDYENMSTDACQN